MVAGNAGVETLEEIPTVRVSDDDLTIRMANVAGKFSPASGRVDANHRGPRQRCRSDPEDELGHVVEQDADMRRSSRFAQCTSRCGADARRRYGLGPGVFVVFEEDRRSRVVGTVDEELRDGP